MSRPPEDPITEPELRRAIARTFPADLREPAWARLQGWAFARSAGQAGFPQLVALRFCDGTLEDLAARMADVEGDIRDVLFGIQRRFGPDWVTPFVAE